MIQVTVDDKTRVFLRADSPPLEIFKTPAMATVFIKETLAKEGAVVALKEEDAARRKAEKAKAEKVEKAKAEKVEKAKAEKVEKAKAENAKTKKASNTGGQG